MTENCCRCSGKYNAVYEAAKENDVDGVNRLLSAGRPVDEQDKSWRLQTPLHKAAYYGFTVLVDLLLNNSANVRAVDNEKNTPLHEAARNGHTQAVEMLINKGANVNVVNKFNKTPLHHAAEDGNKQSAEALLSTGAKTSIVDEDNKTALHYAAGRGDNKLVEALLSAGADTNVIDMDKKTPLHLAVEHTDSKSVQALLSAGANTDVVDKDNRTPLHYAVRLGDTKSVEALLSKGAKINVVDKSNNTPLHTAAGDGLLSIVRLLVNKDANVNVINDKKENALIKVLQFPNRSLGIFNEDKKRSSLDILKLLLERNIDFEYVTKDGNTPLQYINSNISSAGMKTDFYKDAKILLMKAKQQRQHSELLMKQCGDKVDSTKMYFCGHGAVGKTTLKKTLKKSVLSSFRRRAPKIGKDEHIPTPGISIENVNLPGVGKCSIWDIAGQSQYFVSHSMFFDAGKATFIVVYKIVDYKKTSDGYILIRPMDIKQLAMNQVTFWLKFIRGLYILSTLNATDQPLIILVATRADWTGEYRQEAEIVVSEILKECIEIMKEDLRILNECFLINGHDGRCADMQRLRAALHTRRNHVLQSELPMPRICKHILECKRKWVAENAGFPVMDWSSYLEFIRNKIDSVVREDFLKKATNYLHNGGEIVQFKDVIQHGDIIAWIPLWICFRVIGPLLASKEFIQFSNTLPNQKAYKVNEIAKVFDKSINIPLVLQLLQKLELLFLLTRDSKGVSMNDVYVIPTLLPNDVPCDQWMPSSYRLNRGIRIQCQKEIDMLLPQLFHQVQTRLYNKFSELGYKPSGIWRNGIKIFYGVEGLVHLTHDRTAINIFARCENEDGLGECYTLMNMVAQCIFDMRNEISPGCNVEKCVISPISIKNGRSFEEVVFYPLDAIREAERKRSLVYDEHTGTGEKITDLLCTGFDSMFVDEFKSECDVKWILSGTKLTLINLLEVKRDDGTDHRMMAQHMGISNSDREAMEAKASTLNKYVTEQLFDEWSRKWEERIVRDGTHANRSGTEGSPEYAVYYESNIENLLRINNDFLGSRADVREAINSMFQVLHA
uniref:Death-associated protein kinase 1-like n=1 Tax=Saccoglossus kowalevskii TaxID=10224 RepID=A0ABM0MEJ7_SACKO|nr:PREDICTED: death-associated protein kinase 1-like [Saccoglossus kowalevskii]